MHNLDRNRRGKIFRLCISGILIFLLAVTICGCGQRLSERMENVEQETSGENDSPTQAEEEEGSGGVNSLVGGKIEAIAATGALLLNGEYGDLHEKIVADGHRNSEAYISFQKILQDIRDANDATYVYTLIKMSNEMTNLIVDAAEGEDADDYGTPYAMEAQWEKSFAGEPAYSLETWEDGWQGGMLQTASAPIYNSSGEIVAILSIDYPIDDDLACTSRLYGEKIMAIAATGALLLNGEYGDFHEKIVADGHRNSKTYTSFQKILQDIQDTNGATYVYTLIKVSNKMTNLIVDAAEGEDADYYGTPYAMEAQWEKSFAGEPAYSLEIWEDEWQGGMLQTASAPIYNSSGEIVAILSIDYPTDDDLDYASSPYGEKIMAIAVTGASLLNGEYGDLHEKIVADGHRNSKTYTSFQKILQDIQDTSGATYVYTLIKVSNKMTNLIVDAAEGEDADYYGTPYAMEAQWEKSFAGEPAYSLEIWEDEWQGGMLQTASAPIYNSSGDVVAILSIDYPAST